MTEHIKTRNTLKGIPKITTFTKLINSCTLSDEDKTILKLHYIEDKDFRYIGDQLGFAEATIKARHRKILRKIGKLL